MVALLAGREGGQDPSSTRHRATAIFRVSDASCSRLLPISSGAGCWHKFSSSFLLPTTR